MKQTGPLPLRKPAPSMFKRASANPFPNDRPRRAKARAGIVLGLFASLFATVGVRGYIVAAPDGTDAQAAHTIAATKFHRAELLDRNGIPLAVDVPTEALYAKPNIMTDPAKAAEEIARIFPEYDAETLKRRFNPKRKFIWLRSTTSKEQRDAVRQLKEPGLLFAPRDMRLYPNGKTAAHVLGGWRYGTQGVRSAEILGTAGIERSINDKLNNHNETPFPYTLSIDTRIQSAMRDTLAGGIAMMHAKGGSAIVMEVHTGEVVGLLSLPDFDPNDRPAPKLSGDPSDSPLFNRAVQGVYELGSVFKVFAAAQAIDLGLMTPDTMIDTKGPLRVGRFLVHDDHPLGPELSLTDVLVHSSNIGAAHIAQDIGPERQEAFLKTLGLLDPSPVQLSEAHASRPILPRRWTDVASMTIAYGHGLAVSPMALASAYCAIVNGGHQVTPTLFKVDPETVTPGPRVISEQTSRKMRSILHAIVERGTATAGRAAIYDVGGKTGTADKPKPTGGYSHDKVISTFASAFPIDDPRYVVVVSMDEPEDDTGRIARRTAGWTAVPVAAALIRRVGPLLGIVPPAKPDDAKDP